MIDSEGRMLRPTVLESLVYVGLPYAAAAYAKWAAPTTNEFVKGSLADILVPFGLYNLGTMLGVRPLIKASYVLGVNFAYEAIQGLSGIGTFDPWDYAAYTAGVGLGFLTEVLTQAKGEDRMFQKIHADLLKENKKV